MSQTTEPQVHWSQDKMIEVRLNEPDDFLKVRETLTRIGVASRKEKKLYQSCHILHKQGKYYIVHFKELLLLMVSMQTLLSMMYNVETEPNYISLVISFISKVSIISFTSKNYLLLMVSKLQKASFVLMLIGI